MTNPLPLEFGLCYHIYNRGVNRENIYIEERNYPYFLRLWGRYIDQIADTCAYCLLRNHFHAVIHVRDDPGIRLRASRQFSNLFNAYARAVNLASGRSGALFERPFHPIAVLDEAYLARLIVYVHQNAQKHGFVNRFQDWPHSSYHELIGHRWAVCDRQTVMELFGGRDMFLRVCMQNHFSVSF
jgi:REP element-mobilizing transposase RayT